MSIDLQRHELVADAPPAPTVPRRHGWRYGIILGLGFFGIAALYPVYNTYVPLILSNLGLSSTAVGFVMGWDNWLMLFIPAWAGTRSDRTWTRLGRRKPWILASAPPSILLFALIPFMPALAGLLILLVVVNLALAVIRAPGLSLLGDTIEPSERSKASGVVNLLGGLGAVAALVGSGFIYDRLGPGMPFVLASIIMLGSTLVFALAVRERREWGAASTGHTEDALRQRARLAGILRGRERDAALVLLAMCFAWCAYDSIETWISSFGAQALGLAPDRIPFILAAFAGALLLAAAPAGFLGARIGQRRAVLLGMVLLAVLFSAGVFIRSETMLVVLLAPAGAAWALIIANMYPLLYAVAGDEDKGMFTGLYYTVTSAAAIFGPAVVGALLDATGQDFRLMWVWAGLTMAVGWVLLRGVRSE